MRGSLYKILLIFVIIVIGNISPLYAQTKEIENQQEKIKQLERDIKFLDNQILETQKRHKNTLEELVLIRKKISNRKALISSLDNEIKGYNNEIKKKNENIIALEKRLDTLETYYKHLIVNAYKSRDKRVWFLYILTSNSIEQGYRRWSYLKNYAKNIKLQANRINLLHSSLVAEKENLSKLKSKSLATLSLKEEEFNTLKREEQQATKQSANLSSKQKEFTKELNKKRAESNRLAKEVEKLIAEAIRKEQLLKEQAEKRMTQERKEGKTATPSTLVAASEKLSKDFASNKGKLPWPIEGVVIEQFGEHPHPTLKNIKLPFNNGVNISSKRADSVRAIFSGVVKQVIAIPGYNQCVLVQHGGYFSFYCKLSTVLVKVGDNLSTGDIIGVVEVSSNNTSTLHFELWEGTNKQNPELWLKSK